jgi:hypothetical protein
MATPFAIWLMNSPQDQSGEMKSASGGTSMKNAEHAITGGGDLEPILSNR